MRGFFCEKGRLVDLQLRTKPSANRGATVLPLRSSIQVEPRANDGHIMQSQSACGIFALLFFPTLFLFLRMKSRAFYNTSYFFVLCGRGYGRGCRPGSIQLGSNHRSPVTEHAHGRRACYQRRNGACAPGRVCSLL